MKNWKGCLRKWLSSTFGSRPLLRGTGKLILVNMSVKTYDLPKYKAGEECLELPEIVLSVLGVTQYTLNDVLSWSSCCKHKPDSKKFACNNIVCLLKTNLRSLLL
jgi:hypothetical protein